MALLLENKDFFLPWELFYFFAWLLPASSNYQEQPLGKLATVFQKCTEIIDSCKEDFLKAGYLGHVQPAWTIFSGRKM